MAPRLNAQRFFLTYAQCADLSQSDLADFLYDTHSPSWIELAREVHADGGHHIHVVIIFGARFQGQMGSFDYEGYHPNIETIKHGKRDIYRVRHYIRKEDKETHSEKHHDGPCCYSGVPYTRGAVPVYTDETERLSYGDILDKSTTAAEFLDLVRRYQPADYVLRNDAIEQFAAYHFTAPQEYTPAFAPDSFVVPHEVDEWMAEVFNEVSL